MSISAAATPSTPPEVAGGVSTAAAAAVFICVLLLLGMGLPPAAAGVATCSHYCRAKCSLDCKDRSSSVVSVCSTRNAAICRIAPEVCDECRAGIFGACFGACYGDCTDDCI